MKAGHHGIKKLKETDMKKILAFIVLSVSMVSCYEDYIKDYTHSAIYFPYQIDVRTFVVGEGMKIEVGAALGGVRENTRDRNVSYILDGSLLPAALSSMKIASQGYIKNSVAPVATLTQLPSTHYTNSNSSTMVIKKGWHSGTVVIKPDSVNFLNDSLKTLYAYYALPFYITEADADSLVKDRRSNVVGLKFENMLFGKYWHGGRAIVERPGLPNDTVRYKTSIPSPEGLVWELKTAGPTTLVTNGYLNTTTGKDELKITLKGTKIYVSSAAGSSFTYSGDGESIYNAPKLLQNRKIFLKYKYTNTSNNYVYHCTDTLTFRNRLRDGINEWQDENPSHYGK